MEERHTQSSARLGIIISMFPELHETFILRELVALERRGVRFDIYSLQYPRDPITLDDAIRLSTERTHYSGLLTPTTLLALLRTLVNKPVRLLCTIAELVWHGRDRPVDILKNLAILPITLHFERHGRQHGITHWHGHWANVPTTACWYLSRIHEYSWSAAIHGEDIFSANRFLPHKLNDATFTVVCSHYFCKHLQQKLELDSPQDVHLNYHGLDPRVMQRVRHKAPDKTAASDKLAVVSIGRLVPTKGHDVIIRACAELLASEVPVHLQIIGSGPLETELIDLVATLKLEAHVEFCGAMAFEDVLQTLEQADIFALAPRMIPGQPPDGIPNVIAEAMALGVPVVTTRVSAIPELVSDQETGFLVEVDDSQAMAAAMQRLFANPQIAEQFSNAARKRVARLFDQDANINDLLSLFERYLPSGFQQKALPDT